MVSALKIKAVQGDRTCFSKEMTSSRNWNEARKQVRKILKKSVLDRGKRKYKAPSWKGLWYAQTEGGP